MCWEAEAWPRWRVFEASLQDLKEWHRKKVWHSFSGNSWNIKGSLGGNFTLGVFIFRKTEHHQPIKICVHWGIPVPWHDNLLFKCTAAFLPYTTEQSRQLIHYHWAPSFSPSHHFPTPFPPFCSPRPLSAAAPLWKPSCVLLLNLQTGLDQEQQCSSEAARSSSREGGYQGGRYLEVLSVVNKF